MRAERFRGYPDQMRHIFRAVLGALITRCSPGLQRLPWIQLPLGGCLVRLRPTAPLNSPPRRRGIPSPLRCVGIHTGEEGMCVFGGREQPWGPASGEGLGSTVAMGSVERH